MSPWPMIVFTIKSAQLPIFAAVEQAQVLPSERLGAFGPRLIGGMDQKAGPAHDSADGPQ
jgi:hypothetical protein